MDNLVFPFGYGVRPGGLYLETEFNQLESADGFAPR
jgi:hypothetical protein